MPITVTGQSLKVMSYNIHHGADSEEVFTHEKIGQFIKSSGVEIVGLQEVDSICERSGKSDQMKIFAKITGMEATFGRHFAYDGGAYGLGILSRYPMRDIRNDRITSIRSNGEKGTLALLSAKLTLPSGQDIIFATVHFALDQTTRMQQAKEVLGYLDCDLPVILTGDLNAEPHSEEIKLLNTKLFNTQSKADHTFPFDQPIKKIDYIMVSRKGCSVVIKTMVVSGNHLSDHLPIISEVKIGEE
ncbi:endonuclease/exonuclease/phosphatase family protein [Echinicola soli]|uniref:endonuclease/exonuclease/phosphatase family protein n=1 Tax=Echinicola soli TaxID=2591634 RepID=UPI001E625831|nr:endonuclease/exonuclease/phosphatase family protein [Echinicola soli]